MPPDSPSNLCVSDPKKKPSNCFGSNARYNCTYFLSFKREFYYINEKKEFIVTTNVGLKKTTNEEYKKSVLYRFMDKAKKLVLLADPSCTQLESYKFVKSILEDYWDGKL